MATDGAVRTILILWSAIFGSVLLSVGSACAATFLPMATEFAPPDLNRFFLPMGAMLGVSTAIAVLSEDGRCAKGHFATRFASLAVLLVCLSWTVIQSAKAVAHVSSLTTVADYWLRTHLITIAWSLAIIGVILRKRSTTAKS
jgi:hypothetical protein